MWVFVKLGISAVFGCVKLHCWFESKWFGCVCCVRCIELHKLHWVELLSVALMLYRLIQSSAGLIDFVKCRLIWCDNVKSSCRSYQIAKGKIDLTDSGNYWYQLQLMPDKFSWHGWWLDNVINILIRATRCGQWHCWMKWKVHYEGIGRRVTQVSSSNVRDLWFAPILPLLTPFFFWLNKVILKKRWWKQNCHRPFPLWAF